MNKLYPGHVPWVWLLLNFIDVNLPFFIDFSWISDIIFCVGFRRWHWTNRTGVSDSPPDSQWFLCIPCTKWVFPIRQSMVPMYSLFQVSIPHQTVNGSYVFPVPSEYSPSDSQWFLCIPCTKWVFPIGQSMIPMYSLYQVSIPHQTVNGSYVFPVPSEYPIGQSMIPMYPLYQVSIPHRTVNGSYVFAVPSEYSPHCILSWLVGFEFEFCVV